MRQRSTVRNTTGNRSNSNHAAPNANTTNSSCQDQNSVRGVRKQAIRSMGQQISRHAAAAPLPHPPPPLQTFWQTVAWVVATLHSATPTASSEHDRPAACPSADFCRMWEQLITPTVSTSNNSTTTATMADTSNHSHINCSHTSKPHAPHTVGVGAIVIKALGMEAARRVCDGLRDGYVLLALVQALLKQRTDTDTGVDEEVPMTKVDALHAAAAITAHLQQARLRGLRSRNSDTADMTTAITSLRLLLETMTACFGVTPPNSLEGGNEDRLSVRTGGANDFSTATATTQTAALIFSGHYSTIATLLLRLCWAHVGRGRWADACRRLGGGLGDEREEPSPTSNGSDVANPLAKGGVMWAFYTDLAARYGLWELATALHRSDPTSTTTIGPINTGAAMDGHQKEDRCVSPPLRRKPSPATAAPFIDSILWLLALYDKAHNRHDHAHPLVSGHQSRSSLFSFALQEIDVSGSAVYSVSTTSREEGEREKEREGNEAQKRKEHGEEEDMSSRAEIREWSGWYSSEQRRRSAARRGNAAVLGRWLRHLGLHNYFAYSVLHADTGDNDCEDESCVTATMSAVEEAARCILRDDPSSPVAARNGDDDSDGNDVSPRSATYHSLFVFLQSYHIYQWATATTTTTTPLRSTAAEGVIGGPSAAGQCSATATGLQRRAALLAAGARYLYEESTAMAGGGAGAKVVGVGVAGADEWAEGSGLAPREEHKVHPADSVIQAGSAATPPPPIRYPPREIIIDLTRDDSAANEEEETIIEDRFETEVTRQGVEGVVDGRDPAMEMKTVTAVAAKTPPPPSRTTTTRGTEGGREADRGQQADGSTRYEASHRGRRDNHHPTSSRSGLNSHQPAHQQQQRSPSVIVINIPSSTAHVSSSQDTHATSTRRHDTNNSTTHNTDTHHYGYDLELPHHHNFVYGAGSSRSASRMSVDTSTSSVASRSRSRSTTQPPASTTTIPSTAANTNSVAPAATFSYRSATPLDFNEAETLVAWAGDRRRRESTTSTTSGHYYYHHDHQQQHGDRYTTAVLAASPSSSMLVVDIPSNARPRGQGTNEPSSR